jgi:hypothetical protein
MAGAEGGLTLAKSRVELLDEIEAKAKETQLAYAGCGRTVLFSMQHFFPFIPDELIRAASALSGGCAASGASCGAFCAGLLAIGLKLAPWIEDKSDEATAKRDLARKAEYEFRDAFIKEFGSVLCPKVQERVMGRSWNLNDPGEMEEFMHSPDHDKCSIVASWSARRAAKILLENDET